MKRHCLRVPTPEDWFEKQFEKWFDKVFEREFEPILNDFDYCYEDWFNRQDAKQQREVEEVEQLEDNQLRKRFYEMFCKLEKQPIDDAQKHPKTRCICAPNAAYKVVAGPVIDRMNQLFSKQLFGYCGGKNWEAQELEYQRAYEKGYQKLFKGDISALDRTLKRLAKRTLERIFLHVKDRVYHVGEDVYVQHMTQIFHRITAKYRTKTGEVQMGNVVIEDTRLTGDPETTVGNTVWVLLNIRFVTECLLGWTPEEYGLWVKGDDFSVAYAFADEKLVRAAFSKVFCSDWKTATWGNGMILKFLEFTDLKYNDFCSTETFRCDTCGRFNITRQLWRYLTLTPYSRDALTYNEQQLSTYLHKLGKANLFWMDDLPIYRAYNIHLTRNKEFKCKLNDGLPRKYRSIPKGKQHLIKPVTAFEQHVRGFTKDYHSTLDRVTRSREECCKTAFIVYLDEMFGILPSDIAGIEADLSSDQPKGWQLGEAYTNYKQRKQVDLTYLYGL